MKTKAIWMEIKRIEEEVIWIYLILHSKKIASAKQKPSTLEIIRMKKCNIIETVQFKYSIANSVTKTKISIFHQHYHQKYEMNN